LFNELGSHGGAKETWQGANGNIHEGHNPDRPDGGCADAACSAYNANEDPNAKILVCNGSALSACAAPQIPGLVKDVIESILTRKWGPSITDGAGIGSCFAENCKSK
jgi:hypothetical protein